MKISLDRTFRIVWLVVGGLVLVLLLVVMVLVAAQWMGNAGASDDAVRVATETQAQRPEAPAVRYGGPRAMRGTATRIVLVSYGDGDAGGYSRSSRAGEGAWVNAVFLDAGGARLLLDRAAYISDITYPAVDETRVPASDSLQTWITYVMAVDDSNGDRKLDHRDPQGLFVSDVEGRNLRPVLRPPMRYLSHQALNAGRMLVYALEPPAGREVSVERMRQRAFLYDVASGRLTPYVALDSVAARAGQVLAR